jgi:hypothetical protein
MPSNPAWSDSIAGSDPISTTIGLNRFSASTPCSTATRREEVSNSSPSG